MTKPLNRFVFHRVFVTVAPDNSKLIEWQLDDSFKPATSTFRFYVEVSRAAGEWTRLNPTAPVIDDCLFVDPTRYRYNLTNDVFYRVVLDDGGPEELVSKPEGTMGVLSRHNFLIMRDIIRKEYLRLQKFGGELGWLLKRRKSGALCPTCRDHDTGTVVTSQCTTCFGTRYVKGYYNAYPFFTELGGTASGEDVTMPAATNNQKARQVRAVAYPRMDTYDIWVDGDKNKRYFVRKVEDAASMGGKPLIYVAQFREIPTTDISYQVPLEQPITEEELENEPTLKDGGWRTGLSRVHI
jgi:hypothetical protein